MFLLYVDILMCNNTAHFTALSQGLIHTAKERPVEQSLSSAIIRELTNGIMML